MVNSLWVLKVIRTNPNGNISRWQYYFNHLVNGGNTRHPLEPEVLYTQTIVSTLSYNVVLKRFKLTQVS